MLEMKRKAFLDALEMGRLAVIDRARPGIPKALGQLEKLEEFR